jgi:hypothetical protein
MLVSSLLVSCLAAPPKIAGQYTATITSTTTGDVPGIPKGTQTYTEYYDCTCFGIVACQTTEQYVFVTVVNKRKRLDFTDQGYSKVYRYDVQDRNHRPFPAPRGYKFDLGPSKLSCCWVWLVDSDTGDNEEMDEVKIPAKATDRGATTKNGVSVEEWFAKGTVVLAESESDWFVGENSTITKLFNVLIKMSCLVGRTTTGIYSLLTALACHTCTPHTRIIVSWDIS